MQPKIIALNGWPKAGKSEVANLLVREYDAVIVDDGEILRKAAPILFHGIIPEDCYTQEGKSKTVEVNGRTITVRQALGYLGDILEGFFGEDYIPDQTAKRIAELPPAPYFVLPSVRKGQGWFYKGVLGAAVVEIVRPGLAPSGNAFDEYDRNAVDIVLENSGSLVHLRNITRMMMIQQYRDPGIGLLER